MRSFPNFALKKKDLKTNWALGEKPVDGDSSRKFDLANEMIKKGKEV